VDSILGRPEQLLGAIGAGRALILCPDYKAIALVTHSPIDQANHPTLQPASKQANQPTKSCNQPTNQTTTLPTNHFYYPTLHSFPSTNQSTNQPFNQIASQSIPNQPITSQPIHQPFLPINQPFLPTHPPSNMFAVLGKLLELCTSMDLNQRHGAILATAEVTHSLAEVAAKENK
jgi:hypothetical protein